MAKFYLPCVVSLLLLLIFSVDTIPLKVEGKTCTVAWQGCKTLEECDVQCLGRYSGRGYCFKPPITSFVECRCEYPC
ncbi:hypothetical protein MKW92_042062 [Papaver armeniacum]|nr:hypothetical protein MKW92_042062 [Papaver armeniacum]